MREITAGCLLLVALGCAAPAQTLMVVENWGGEGHFAHAGTMKIDEEGKRISFDLSALPRRAKVHRARLVCFREAPAGDSDDALVNVEIVLKGRKKPLELIPPWYDALAVPASAVKGGKSLSFQVEAFPGWIREKTFLEIAYGAKAGADLPRVRGVKAFHRAGQTFITWQEIEKALDGGRPTWREVKAALENLDDARAVRYRVYRSEEPITPVNLHEAALLAEVRPLSGHNINGRSADQAFHVMRKRMLVDMDYAKGVSKSHYAIPRSAHDDVVIDRFVIPASPAGRPSGKGPIPNGTGLYVHHPAKAGRGYYAVTVVVNGRENTTKLATAGPVGEKPGPGKPVFQRELDMKVLFDYAGRRLQYVQWTGGIQAQNAAIGDPAAAPPLSNLPNQHYNWSVFIPEGVKYPAPLEVVLTGNGMFRRPRWPHRLDTILVSPHDAPFRTFYYGYHESAGTLRSLRQGTIQPFTWRRMLTFLSWAFDEFKIDQALVTCSGDRGYSSTAALHFGMRNPEVFSLVYTCKGMPNPAALPAEVKMASWHRRPSKTLVAELEKLVGKKEWGLKTGGLENVWEFFNLTAEVAATPKVLRPMLSYGGRGQWDWPPIAEFLKAVAAARQPIISEGTWGAINPPGVKNPGAGRSGLNVRRDRPVPVFAGCSSDYQGGRNGGGGATNYGVWWQDESIVDEADRFEIILTGNVSVDVTPRRTRKFILRPGEKVRFKTELLGTRLRRQDKPQSGEAVADENGLVTIPRINVRGKARLILTRSAS